MSRIIVDDDNTLWYFTTSFRKKTEHLGVPRPPERRSDVWKASLTIDQVLHFIDNVHEEQDAGALPFPEAVPFLSAVRRYVSARRSQGPICGW